MRKVEGTATISIEELDRLRVSEKKESGERRSSKIVHIQSQQGKTGHLHRSSTEEMDVIGI